MIVTPNFQALRAFCNRLAATAIVVPFLLCCTGVASAQKVTDKNAAAPARADTADKITVTIAKSENFYSFHTDTGDYSKFVDSVILYQGTDTLYCDSLYQNAATKNFEAFGDVKVAQMGGTHGTCSYLRYTTSEKLAFMTGNVQLTDGKNTLICTELTYNLGTKVAVYDNWGQLHSDSTVVTSKSATYNAATRKAHFVSHVVVQDPQYDIRSEDMIYNTDSKVTEFYAQSVVTRDSGKSILTTHDGSYDGLHGVAHFTSHSSIWNDGQYIEGDSLYYNKLTGYGMADGHVVSIDTGHHSVLFCGHSEYYTFKKVLWATIKPVLLQVNGRDSFYMRADTLYSAPMKKVQTRVVAKRRRDADETAELPNDIASEATGADTMQVTDTSAVAPLREQTLPALTWEANFSYPDYLQHKIDTVRPPDSVIAALYDREVRERNRVDSIKQVARGKSRKTTTATKTAKKEERTAKKDEALHIDYKVPAQEGRDTAATDTTAPLYFIGYHHVLIFSDSLQAKCDSICYTRSDSTVRLMIKPIAWAHNSQVTGDTILLRQDSSEMKSMYVPNNAFMVSVSGPEKAQLFNQVQGKTLTAYFIHSAIRRLKVFPDAQSIYYSQDEKNYYLGVMQATADTMETFFHDQKMERISLRPEVHQTMTPMEKADLPGMKLSRFKWLIDQRPKQKEELFR